MPARSTRPKQPDMTFLLLWLVVAAVVAVCVGSAIRAMGGEGEDMAEQSTIRPYAATETVSDGRSNESL